MLIGVHVQIIEMLKVQMVEMKSLLESKVTELKTKLEAEANEKKKTEADAAQWKAMAQKELKTRLQVNTTLNHVPLTRPALKCAKNCID